MDLITQDVNYRKNQLCARHNDRILARVVADSIAEGVRLTTLEIVFPRIVLAEFNTHRVFSRNSASSRAIPVEKMLAKAVEDPYVPSTWGRNGRGMQAKEDLGDDEARWAAREWLSARDSAVCHARNLLEIGVHKQTTNRVLEPYLWHTCVVTATDWSNFRHLRAHADAHPDIQDTARAVIAVLDAHEPVEVYEGCFHLPFCTDRDGEEVRERDLAVRLQVGMGRVQAMLSAARCARVSYETHAGVRDIDEDLRLHDQLLAAGHMSPFEHPACALPREEWVNPDPPDTEAKKNSRISNFCFPWMQYRKMLPYEWDIYSDPHRVWEPA